MISIRDTKKFAETSHPHCLYPSFNVCCYGPRFTCTDKYGHGQGRHQSYLGADGDVLVLQMTFSLVTAAMVWAILESTSGLNPSSDTIAPRYFKLRTVSRFLLSMLMSVLMPLVLFVINWVFSALICMSYAVEASSR